MEMAGADLSDKFADLERDHGADDALAALKAKMGMGAAATSQASSFSFEEEEVGVGASSGSNAGGASWDREDF